MARLWSGEKWRSSTTTATREIALKARSPRGPIMLPPVRLNVLTDGRAALHPQTTSWRRKIVAIGRPGGQAGKKKAPAHAETGAEDKRGKGQRATGRGLAGAGVGCAPPGG